MSKEEFDGQETSLLAACDNLGALNEVGSRRDKTKPALKSFDLITALTELETWLIDEDTHPDIQYSWVSSDQSVHRYCMQWSSSQRLF